MWTKRKPCINLTGLLSSAVFYEPPTKFQIIRQHIWKACTGSLIVICLILILFLKVAAFAVAELTSLVVTKNHMIEEITLENTRLAMLQSGTTEDVISIAKSIQEVLNTARGDERRFLESSLPYAIRLQARKGIPASAVVSIAIHESGYGNSTLAKKYNNFFGLKAFGNWNGLVANCETVDEGIRHTQPFRRYDNIYDGFLGFYDFLLTSGNGTRYKESLQQKNGLVFVKTMLDSGYCPDPTYYAQIKTIISRHKLDVLDNITLLDR